MKSISTRGTTVEIPVHVSELTPEQYEYYCFLASLLGSGVINMDYFRIRWFSYLIGMDKTDFTILRAEYIAELSSQMSAIDGYIQTVDNGGSHRLTLDFYTPINLLPTYRGFSGPGDWLDGVTFGEFIECLTVLEGLDEADEADTTAGYAHIARCLYHIPVDEEVPELLLFHAPTLLSSVWKAIMSDPVDINGQKLDFRIIFKSSGNSRPDDKTGWTGITFEVAAAGLFGNVNDVEHTDMWLVLIYLYKCKFEYLSEKRNYK